jgi:hypothetical protein
LEEKCCVLTKFIYKDRDAIPDESTILPKVVLLEVKVEGPGVDHHGEYEISEEKRSVPFIITQTA